MGRGGKRRAPEVVAAVRIGAALEQQRDDVTVAPPGGVVQRRAAHLPREVDRDAEVEQQLDRERPALRRRLVERLEELGPDPLRALRVLGREPQRTVAVAREAEPDQLVDRADLAPRAQLREQLAEVGRPIRQASPYGVRSFCRSTAFTSAPCSTSRRMTSGERLR